MVKATSPYLNKPLRSLEQAQEERRLRELAIYQTDSIVIVNDGFIPCDLYGVYTYNWHNVLMRTGLIYHWDYRNYSYTLLSGGPIYDVSSWSDAVNGVSELINDL